jgi:outer membrane receptor protein involved in Fe transport
VRGASDPTVDGKLVVDSARLRGRFIVESRLPWEGWSAHTQLDANGPRMADAANATQISGYGVLGVGVSYERRVHAGSLQLRLDVENLADRN